jgi:hypothetical protein
VHVAPVMGVEGGALQADSIIPQGRVSKVCMAIIYDLPYAVLVRGLPPFIIWPARAALPCFRGLYGQQGMHGVFTDGHYPASWLHELVVVDQERHACSVTLGYKKYPSFGQKKKS